MVLLKSEDEYNGNKLNFQKTFAIDSGKGSNFTACLAIYDFGQPKQIKFDNGKMSEFHQKAFCLTIADIQKMEAWTKRRKLRKLRKLRKPLYFN